jgi:imidazolonepropionase-like amidohydrolase
MTAPVEVIHMVGRILVDERTERGEAWIVGGRITFERPRHSGDAQTIEGVVLPGLVDVHCHVGLTVGGATDDALAGKQAEADRDTGVLLIRDAGSATDTSWVHDRADLPQLIRAGRFIARPRRYLMGFARELDRVEDLPLAAAEEARRGDGWVKIIADWIDRDLGADADLRPLWPDDVLVDAIAAAHAAGARVTAHTFATEAVQGLLDAGIDCIEHGTGMTPAHIAEAARRGVPVVPTLLQIGQFASIADQGRARFPAFAARMEAMHKARYAQVRRFHEAGVPLLVGTDAGGTIGHGSFAEECAEMVAAGLPARDVVAAATWVARRFLGASGIEEGASADVVAFQDDPRVDIAALGDPSAIVLRGTVFDPRRGA